MASLFNFDNYWQPAASDFEPGSLGWDPNGQNTNPLLQFAQSLFQQRQPQQPQEPQQPTQFAGMPGTVGGIPRPQLPAIGPSMQSVDAMGGRPPSMSMEAGGAMPNGPAQSGFLGRLMAGLGANSNTLIGLGSDISKGGFTKGFAGAAAGSALDEKKIEQRQQQMAIFNALKGKVPPEAIMGALKSPELTKLLFERAYPKDPDPKWGVIGQDKFGNPQYGREDLAAKGQPQPGAPGAGSATGGGPQFKDVTAVSKDVEALPSYKNMAQVAPLYEPMVKAAKVGDRASDLRLIYGIAKILDPIGVVRGTDEEQVRAIQPLPAQIKQSIMSVMSDKEGRLDANTRQQILRIAHDSISEHNNAYEREAGQYRGLAKEWGVDSKNLIPSFGPFEPFKSEQAAPTIDRAEEILRRRRGSR